MLRLALESRADLRAGSLGHRLAEMGCAFLGPGLVALTVTRQGGADLRTMLGALRLPLGSGGLTRPRDTDLGTSFRGLLSPLVSGPDLRSVLRSLRLAPELRDP